MKVSLQEDSLFKRIEELLREKYTKGGGIDSLYVDKGNMEIKAVTKNGMWRIKFNSKS